MVKVSPTQRHNDLLASHFPLLTVAYTFASSYSAPIVALYLLMIWQCRRLMKMFAPWDLRRVLMAHNLVCSLLSLCAVIIFVLGFWQVGTPVGVEVTLSDILHDQVPYSL